MRALLQRDIKIAFRHPGAWLNPLVFAVMVITLFAFGIGPDSTVLRQYGGAILWVVALLSIMLSLESLFIRDFEDGSLELMLLSGCSAYQIALAKILTHWVIVGVPLVSATPLFVLMLGLPVTVLPTLVTGLVLGSGTLCFLGAVGAAVTMSLRSGGAVVALVVLPFYIPVVIFGAAYLQDAMWGVEQSVGPLLLSGMLLLSASLAPPAVAWGIEAGVENA